MYEGVMSAALGLPDNFTMPIITVLNTGNTSIDGPFNWFFSLMVGIGFMIFISAAIMKLLSRS